MSEVIPFVFIKRGSTGSKRCTIWKEKHRLGPLKGNSRVYLLTGMSLILQISKQNRSEVLRGSGQNNFLFYHIFVFAHYIIIWKLTSKKFDETDRAEFNTNVRGGAGEPGYSGDISVCWNVLVYESRKLKTVIFVFRHRTCLEMLFFQLFAVKYFFFFFVILSYSNLYRIKNNTMFVSVIRYHASIIVADRNMRTPKNADPYCRPQTLRDMSSFRLPILPSQIATMSSHLQTWCVWRTCVARWRHPRPCGRPCGPCRRWPVVVGSRWTCCRRPPAVWGTWPKRVRRRLRGPRTGTWTTVCRTSASATRRTRTSRWLSSPTALRRPCPVPWALENEMGLNWTVDSLRPISIGVCYPDSSALFYAGRRRGLTILVYKQEMVSVIILFLMIFPLPPFT